MNQSRILYIFTRTPLHVGAGSSIGAIDQPIQRERHTGFPIIPASSLKGSLADQWPANLQDEKKNSLRVLTRKEGDKEIIDQVLESAWLFGSNNDKAAFSGSLQFGEARVLAFPIRSAKGSFAWITSPLLIQRAARDGAIPHALSEDITEPGDERAFFAAGKDSKLALGDKLVLEEYTFEHAGNTPPALCEAFAKCLSDDPLWKHVADRLVVVSNGMMSFFAKNACEIAQHVCINDETGTAEPGALFNQENVPSDTLFYSVLHAFKSRVPTDEFRERTAAEVFDAFSQKVNSESVFQFGGDASTGLGYCTVSVATNDQHSKNS